MDVYGDNKGIIADGVLEIQSYMDEVLPEREQHEEFTKDLLDIEIDIQEYLPKIE